MDYLQYYHRCSIKTSLFDFSIIKVIIAKNKCFVTALITTFLYMLSQNVEN